MEREKNIGAVDRILIHSGQGRIELPKRDLIVLFSLKAREQTKELFVSHINHVERTGQQQPNESRGRGE